MTPLEFANEQLEVTRKARKLANPKSHYGNQIWDQIEEKWIRYIEHLEKTDDKRSGK